MMNPQTTKQNINLTSKSSRIGKAKLYIIIFSALIVLSFLTILIINIYNKPSPEVPKVNQTLEPQFIPEGSLYFIRTPDSIRISKIIIEIADDETAHERGLMFRRSMADSMGMFFIFEENSPRVFWMRNIYISLDIIFVNDKFEIVDIKKNTTPFSEVLLSSAGDAKFVVEVNAGYTDSKGVKIGDCIRFKRK